MDVIEFIRWVPIGYGDSASSFLLLHLHESSVTPLGLMIQAFSNFITYLLGPLLNIRVIRIFITLVLAP